MAPSRLAIAAAFFQLSSIVAAHGHDEHGGMDMGVAGMSPANSSAPVQNAETGTDSREYPSYAGLSAQSGFILAHIALMVVAWLFVLPIGVVFSVSRSRLALPTQLAFLVLNALGVIVGTIYDINTPDLYENNAHHKIGWIATWVMTAQVAMSLIFLYSGRSKASPVASSERTAFIPVSVEAMAQHDIRPYSDYRWSGDSGQGTERSSMHNSRDISPIDQARRDAQEPYSKPEEEPEDGDGDDDDDHGTGLPEHRGFLRDTLVDKYLSKRVPGMLSKKLLKTLEFVHNTIDRTVLILGFIALTTGVVTYAGIFRGHNIFSGLAHFIKGGIFFWYGLLTLGRWMGCFAEFGWAWNVKPTRSEVGQWKASIPSAEFVESFVIFLYGISNVFLEHLGGWGGAWNTQDLEHVSISIMFLGGGLCGMLIESRKVRDLLNTTIYLLPTRPDTPLSEGQDTRVPPKTYAFPMNPLPGLVILLLGVLMSSHHQNTMVGTMIHKQWGTLLVGFSIARGVTYIITYISPPTSVFASRPPSELVASFCLISGGIIFMASAGDITHALDVNNIMGMFIFTVAMGFTAFLMAWEIIVLAVRGWASRRELQAARY